MKNKIIIHYKNNIILFDTKTKEYIISDIEVTDKMIKNFPIVVKDLWSFYSSYVVGVKKGKLTRLRKLDKDNIKATLKRNGLLK